ncbi:hypothetical protein Lal_00033995 [Lupinus albus]|nr:hypothetical protein Lal_00033995 [Lupinus albus]
MKGKESDFSCSSQSQTLNLIDVVEDGVNVDWRAKYRSFASEQNFATAHRRSELDIYLEDGVLIARDLLAVPITIVASESLFSTRGRILTSHHSRLRPDSIEALMCLQDMLRGDIKGSSNSKLDSIGCGTILKDFDDPTS